VCNLALVAVGRLGARHTTNDVQSSHVIKSEGSSEMLPHAFLAAVLCTTRGLRLAARTIVEDVVAPCPLLVCPALQGFHQRSSRLNFERCVRLVNFVFGATERTGFHKRLAFLEIFFLRSTARSADTRLDFLNRIESKNDDDCIGIGRWLTEKRFGSGFDFGKLKSLRPTWGNMKHFPKV
jgi:hypothetical protein